MDVPFPSTTPRLSIAFNHTTCTAGRGRFVVHELTLDATGALRTFAADFAQACGGDPGFVGAVRFHAGDGACASGGGASSCDDRNPCTRDDRCTGGRARAPRLSARAPP